MQPNSGRSATPACSHIDASACSSSNTMNWQQLMPQASTRLGYTAWCKISGKDERVNIPAEHPLLATSIN